MLQGIVALRALSYLLRLEGETTLAEHYNTTNQKFLQYWLQNATVSEEIVPVLQ